MSAKQIDKLFKLKDCFINNPTANQVLTYEAETALWKNKDNTAGSGYITATSQDILTNKTIDDTSNFVTADAIHCLGTKVNINRNLAPSVNQALIISDATNSPHMASWQTIDHVNLTNKGTNTHTQIDSHISATTAHGTSSNIVGTDDSQILKNKTVTDSSNNVMAKSLKSASTTIDVSSSLEPTLNQALIASSGTSASWQSMTHNMMGDVTYNNIQNSDILRYNSTLSKYVNSSSLSTAETNINELKKKNQIVNTSIVSAGGSIITDYTGGSPNEIVYKDNTTPYYYGGITGFSYSTLHSGQGLQVTNDYIERQTSTATGWSLSTNSFIRWNISLDQSIKMSKISFTGMDCTYNTAQPGTVLIQCYGSNSITDFSDITTSNITLPLLGSGTNQVTFNINFTSNDTYKYLCMKLSTTTINGWFKFINNSKAQIERSDGTFQALTIGTDYTITTDVNTGKPILTFTNAGTIHYNLDRLLLNESYSRLYKQTAKGLQTASTIVNIASATAPTAGQVLVATGSTGASWQTPSSGSTSLAGLTTDVDVTTTPPVNGNLLIYNGSKWVNSDSIPDNLLFVYDDGNNTRKMQFQLSNITAGNTRILTVPDASTTIVGTDVVQTLINKTFTDSTTYFQDDADNTRKIQFQLGGISSGTTRAFTFPNSDGILTIASNIATTGQTLVATSGTSANWSSLGVAGGGTGLSTTTAYGVLCGGTTATGAFQNIGPGTATYMLMSNGAGALPSWQQFNSVPLNTISQVDNKYLNIPLGAIETVSIHKPLTNQYLRYGAPKTPNTPIILTTTGLYRIDDITKKITSYISDTSNFLQTTYFLVQILYVNGLYYGFTYNYVIYTSTNLKLWTAVASNLYTIMTNTAVGSGATGATAIYQANWVIHDGTYFYAGGYKTAGANQHIARSTDAITWTAIGPSSDLYSTSCFHYIPQLTYKYWNGGTNSGNGATLIDYSTDGTNFTQVNYSSYFSGAGLTRTSAPMSITYQNSKIFISLGYYPSDTATIYSSDNGSTWSLVQLPSSSYQCDRICWSPTLSLYIALNTATNTIYSSPDLTNWTSRASGISYMMNILWNNDYFLIYCSNGNVHYSFDGITWTLLGVFGTKVVNIFVDTSNMWYNDYITTTSLSDVSITNNNPTNGDILKYNSATSKWVNSNDLSNIQSNLINYNQTQLEITKTTASVAQNQTITASYTDGTDGSMLYINNSTAVYQTPTTIVYGGNAQYSTPTIVVTQILNFMMSSVDANGYYRLNINYTNAFVPDLISASTQWGLTNGAIGTFAFYGSNSATEYSSTTNSTTNLTLLYTTSVTYPSFLNISQSITTTIAYQYYHIILTCNTGQRPGLTNIQFRRKAGGYNPIVNNTNYNITTDSTTGLPKITYTDATTQDIMFNYPRLLYSEASRRLFPVVRDANTIKLTDGTNTVNLTSTTCGYAIDKLSNVNITSATHNDMLKYDVWTAKWKNVASDTLSYDTMTYVQPSDFSVTNHNYTCNVLTYGFVIDITNTWDPLGSDIVLPYYTTNGQSVFIEIVGTQGSTNKCIFYAPLLQNIYTDLNTTQGDHCDISSGYTYWCIYCTAYNNDWAPSNGSNSWKVINYGTFGIPLNPFTNVTMIQTVNHSMTGYFSLPATIKNGRHFYLSDENSYMSTSGVILCPPSNNSYNTIFGVKDINGIAQSVSLTYSAHLLYMGDGTHGNIVRIKDS